MAMVQPADSAVKANEILARFRPIAPKPALAAEGVVASNRVLCQLQSRPCRARKRGRPTVVPVSPKSPAQPASVAKKGRSTSADAMPPKAGGASTRVRRGVEELLGLFPNLASEVEKITDDDSLVPVLKRAFELIDDQKAGELDAKVKKQKVREVQARMNQDALRDEVFKMLIRYMD